MPATFLSGNLTSHLADISNIQASITIQPPPFSVTQGFSAAVLSLILPSTALFQGISTILAQISIISPLLHLTNVDAITIFDCQLQVKPGTLRAWLQHLCVLLWLTLCAYYPSARSQAPSVALDSFNSYSQFIPDLPCPQLGPISTHQTTFSTFLSTTFCLSSL